MKVGSNGTMKDKEFMGSKAPWAPHKKEKPRSASALARNLCHVLTPMLGLRNPAALDAEKEDVEEPPRKFRANAEGKSVFPRKKMQMTSHKSDY